MNIFNFNDASTLVGNNVSFLGLDGEGAIELQVVSVVEITTMGDQWSGFSVVFTGNQIEQGTYEISSGALEGQTLFLSPNSETECEAIVTYKLLAEADDAVEDCAPKGKGRKNRDCD